MRNGPAASAGAIRGASWCSANVGSAAPNFTKIHAGRDDPLPSGDRHCRRRLVRHSVALGDRQPGRPQRRAQVQRRHLARRKTAAACRGPPAGRRRRGLAPRRENLRARHRLPHLAGQGAGDNSNLNLRGGAGDIATPSSVSCRPSSTPAASPPPSSSRPPSVTSPTPAQPPTS